MANSQAKAQQPPKADHIFPEFVQRQLKMVLGDN
jgi:hypothetical protein